MSFFSGKKLLLVGFIIVLLVAIPVTVYLVQQQQKTKSGAEAATTLSLVQTPQNVKAGDTITFDVMVDPSSVNQVGYVQLVLSYDPTKLATQGAGVTVVPWPSADGGTFTPSIPIGPDYSDGTITIAMSVGGSAQNLLQAKTKIATVTFKALTATDTGIPTQVTFGNQTQVLSGADQGNVLSNTIPGQVNITPGEEVFTPVLTLTQGGRTCTNNSVNSPAKLTWTHPTATTSFTVKRADTAGGSYTTVSTSNNFEYEITSTQEDSYFVVSTQGGPDSNEVFAARIPDVSACPTASVTTSVTATVSPTGAPLSCSSLTLDPGPSGTIPFSVNLTAIGASTIGTITKVTFDFGDGQTQDVTDAGGIGTNSVSVLTSHTYATSGTFNASVVLTDDSDNVSSGGCTATITTTGESGASPTAEVSPSPLPPTGPTELVTVGAIGVMLTFIGALLLLAL